MVSDLARLDARTDANGGHGNDRPTQVTPSKHPGFRSPFESCIYLTANRYPLTALTYAYSST
jgi:hypothetical protein